MQDAQIEKVTLRHPHTGDTVEVDGLPEKLTVWMHKGYQQVRTPAEKET